MRAASLLAVAALLAPSGYLAADAPEARPESAVKKEFPASGLKKIEIRSSAGFIAVGRAEQATVSVEALLKRFPGNCKLDMKAQDGRLVIHAREKRKSYYGLSWGQDGCESEISIRAPQHLEIDAATGSGNLAVSQLVSKISFRSASGSLRLKDVRGAVSARSGSGGVEGEGLTEPVEVRTGGGNVRLSWERAPEEGEIKVRAGSGGVSLDFPAGTQASVSLKTGNGAPANALGNKPGAALKISVRTGSGAVVLRPRSP